MDLLRRRAPEEDELSAFAHSVRAALLASPERGGALVPRLAEAARRCAPPAAGAAPAITPAPGRATRPRRRLRPAAQIVLAVALVPLAFAGLAVAGVQVPDTARSAFQSVGIELPNQTAAEGSKGAIDAEPGADRSREGSGPGGENGEYRGDGAAPAKRGQVGLGPNAGPEGDRSQGNQGNGHALGKQGQAPGQNRPKGGGGKGGSSKGGSAQGNAGGNSGSAPPGQAKKPATPGGSGSGGGGANGKGGGPGGNGAPGASPGGKK
jgi:hypothetical protein